MKLYSAIDLHSNNHVLTIIDEQDQKVFERRLPNKLEATTVKSERLSNGKKKGEGNRKNGNRYLGWAYVEAANFAVRHCEPAKRFFQRKLAQRNRALAVKATANKLAKACFHIMRDQAKFETQLLFS